MWLAQSGTLEFHVWHSRAKPGPDARSESTDYASSLAALEASVLNYPDYVVFDIDPYIYSGKEAQGAEPELNTVAFEKGKEVAFWLRELLPSMSLESIVKTSGKTGLHVFVPIRRTLDFDAARHVSELVGRHLMRLHPKDITMEWSVPKRTGKIFMDYNMNVRGKTLNVAYSPRGVPGAPVSMPLTWEELASAHPLDFRIPNASERLAANGRSLERRPDPQTEPRKRALQSARGLTTLKEVSMAARSIASLTVSFGLVSIPGEALFGHRGELGDLVQPAAQDLRLAAQAAVRLRQGGRRGPARGHGQRATSSPRTST